MQNRRPAAHGPRGTSELGRGKTCATNRHLAGQIVAQNQNVAQKRTLCATRQPRHTILRDTHPSSRTNCRTNSKMSRKNAPSVRHVNTDTRFCATPAPLAGQSCLAKSQVSRKTDQACDNRAQPADNATKTLRTGQICFARDERLRGQPTAPRTSNKSATHARQTRINQPGTHRNAERTTNRAETQASRHYVKAFLVLLRTRGKPGSSP